MPNTPTNFDFLDASEHVGSEYDHIRKALKLYVKVIEALKTRDESDRVTIEFTVDKMSRGKKVGEKKCSASFDPVINERFQRVLHYMNEHFYNPNNGGLIGEMDPLYAQALIEVKKMFNGVDENGEPYRRGKDKEYAPAETGKEYTQRMWSLPPELLEPTIAICVARDFLCHHKGRFRPSEGITVRGKKVNPWTGFAKRYIDLILCS